MRAVRAPRASYIVLTSWVIMSLFIGVIAMGMFDSFDKMKTETKAARAEAKMQENSKARLLRARTSTQRTDERKSCG